MKKRPSFWSIVESKTGEYSVYRGNRPVSTGLRNQSSAYRIVARHRQSTEKVTLIEPDGYRTDLTKRFAN